MSEEETIEILNDYLCKTHNQFCKIGAVGIPNPEYFAIERLLDLYQQQKQQITELQSINDEHKKENGELRETIKNYEEKQNKLAFKTNQYMNDVLQNKIISKSKVEKEFEKFTSHNNCFNLGDMQMLLDNIIEEE